MKWSAYLRHCAAFKPFRPHAAASPCDGGAARSVVVGASPSILDDDHLADVEHAGRFITNIHAELRRRHELRERLQALEAWRLDAGLELPAIEELIWHYRDALGGPYV